VATINEALTDGILPRGVLEDIKVHNPTLDDTMVFADSLSSLLGLVLAERIAIDQREVVNHRFNQSIAEQARFLDVLLRGLPAELAEGALITASQIVQRAVSVIEALRLEDTILPAVYYNISLVERVRLADAIARFFGADVLDGLTVSETLAGAAYKTGQVAEGATIADTPTPLLLLRVSAADTIELDDVDAVRMLFSGELADGIQLSAAYLAPGGNVTTWVMNTRTAAISEYQNFAFNSFARMGNKYLGASDDGLYELTGDDDAGTDIIATIRSGFAQWAGTHLGSFKAAYLAVRGEGDFVLRILSATGQAYNYAVTAESMRTVKVNMGKGLRARYFAFELVSTGQDFDLDTLEFIPLVAERRV